MIRRPPRSTLFPTRRSSDLGACECRRDIQPRMWGSRRNWSRHCTDRKSTRLNSSHVSISYAVFCLKKKIFAKAFTGAKLGKGLNQLIAATLSADPIGEGGHQ